VVQSLAIFLIGRALILMQVISPVRLL